MKIKQITKRILFAVLGLCMLFAAVIGGRVTLPAFAAETKVTTALEDLQKDESFNTADYPDDATDYTIKVIQIAESTAGELIVYTYQPSQKTTYLVATDINMSLSETAEGTKLYSLTLLNTSGVFGKYLVNDLTVSSAEVRYYNVTSISREWIKGIDGESGTDNTKNSVAFPVGRLFKVETKNNTLVYSDESTQVVQIINPFADTLRYNNGFHWSFVANWTYTDVHYIAFDTDFSIDKLMEAEISFSEQSYQKKGDNWSYGEAALHEPITINGEEKGGNTADGWGSKKFEWNRIQPIEEFIETDGLKEETKEVLQAQGAKWVLLFYETEVTLGNDSVGNTPPSEYGTKVSDVRILRLEFVTAGTVYNLGAVSDGVTGDSRPGNDNVNELAGLFEWLERVTGVAKWVWILLFVIIILAVLLPILGAVIPPFGKFLIKILKGLWWLICAPFRGIAALVKKSKSGKKGKRKKSGKGKKK